MRADALPSQSEFDDYVDRTTANVHQLAPADGDAERPRAAAMAKAMRAFTAQELDNAKAPCAHAFQANQSGFFPIGEVTVVAAQGREGKTFALTAIAAAFVRGKRMGGFLPVADRCAVIYSAEDSRDQYASKVAALKWIHGDKVDAVDWWTRIIVPNLEDPDLLQWRELVTVVERRPCKGFAVEAIIDALSAPGTLPKPAGLLIFETASTLSDADEDNAGLKTLVAALKRIAQALQAAVVLVHHTSQAASNNLPTLNIQSGDIRGGTALTFNARQCFFLVNLGSDADPYPENDARTVLRKLVAPSSIDRLSALVCLNSSKSQDPAPVFFQWQRTEWAPALREIDPPSTIRGMPWRKLLTVLNGKRADARAEAKDTKAREEVLQVVRAVEELNQAGEPAFAKTISESTGHKQGWADSRLARAVDEGLLRREQVQAKSSRVKSWAYVVVGQWTGEAE